MYKRTQAIAAAPARHDIRLRSADPGELTLRDARLLGAADVIVHEAEVPPAILARARADARRVVLAVGEPVPDGAGLVVVLRGI